MHFPENLTDDFLGLFIGTLGAIVIAAVIFIGPDEMAQLALGALIAWVGTILAAFLPRKGSSTTPPQE